MSGVAVPVCRVDRATEGHEAASAAACSSFSPAPAPRSPPSSGSALPGAAWLWTCRLSAPAILPQPRASSMSSTSSSSSSSMDLQEQEALLGPDLAAACRRALAQPATGRSAAAAALVDGCAPLLQAGRILPVRLNHDIEAPSAGARAARPGWQLGACGPDLIARHQLRYRHAAFAATPPALRRLRRQWHAADVSPLPQSPLLQVSGGCCSGGQGHSSGMLIQRLSGCACWGPV